MSRSRKKHPVIKDRGLKELYWRTIRKRHKADIFAGRALANPKEVMNDWTYSDYKLSCYGRSCRCTELFGRKKCLEK